MVLGILPFTIYPTVFCLTPKTTQNLCITNRPYVQWSLLTGGFTAQGANDVKEYFIRCSHHDISTFLPDSSPLSLRTPHQLPVLGNVLSALTCINHWVSFYQWLAQTSDNIMWSTKHCSTECFLWKYVGKYVMFFFVLFFFFPVARENTSVYAQDLWQSLTAP